MKNDYEIRGDVTAIFLQTNGNTVECLIDTDDLELVDSFPNRWHFQEGYAKSRIVRHGVATHVAMHRLIMDFPEGYEVDHINHNTLDNRKANLRSVTKSQNQLNRKGATKLSSSGIRGIVWEGQRGKWKIRLTINGKRKRFGYYSTVEEAKVALDRLREKNVINF